MSTLLDSHLSPEGRAFRDEFCQQLGLEPDGWRGIPPLRILMETSAALRAIDDRVRRDGISRTKAEAIVGTLFGLGRSTIGTRLYRLTRSR